MTTKTSKILISNKKPSILKIDGRVYTYRLQIDNVKRKGIELDIPFHVTLWL